MFVRLMGLNASSPGHMEKWVSAAGGLLGILAVVAVSRHFVGLQGAAWIVASMGASAVLLFAVPHGPLSQPWPVLGGHLVSAFIGVACARWIPELLIAASVSVALAIGAMYYLRCIHPPGGATALTAVVGGEAMHALGFQYVLTPVLLNSVTILVIAVLFNYAFPWRRYPAALATRASPPGSAAGQKAEGDEEDALSRGDLKAALQAMNRIIDISEQDLEEIYSRARRNAQSISLRPAEIRLGNYYSNGHYGDSWQVRRIIDMPDPVKSDSDLVIYRVVAGSNRRSNGTATLGDFAHWARYEVYLNESSWQRVGPARGEDRAE